MTGYPAWICHDCGVRHGHRVPEVVNIHMDRCGWCGGRSDAVARTREILAAIEAAPPPPVITEREEPTEAMIDAGYAKAREHCFLLPGDLIAGIYTAMRSAAPYQLDHSSHVEAVERLARALCTVNFAKKGCEGEHGNVDDCWWAFKDDASAIMDALAASPRHVDASTEEMVKVLEEARRLLMIQQNDLLGRGYSPSDEEVTELSGGIAKIDALLSSVGKSHD